VTGWRSQSTAWYLSWSICYEFLRVTTHPRVFRRPWSADQAWSFIEALMDSPSLGLLTATERHAQVLAEVIHDIPHLNGNLWHDAHTAVLMREHGISRIYTRDTDFHRFTFLDPIDPLN
jgi:predicted nucleic acid-binding protein